MKKAAKITLQSGKSNQHWALLFSPLLRNSVATAHVRKCEAFPVLSLGDVRVNKGSVEMCYQNISLLPTSVSDRPSHVLLTSRYTALRRMSMFGWWYTAGLRRSDRTAIACVCVCVPTFATKIFLNGVIGEVLTTLSAKVGRGAVQSGTLAARFRKNMLPCSSTSNSKLSRPSRQ